MLEGTLESFTLPDVFQLLAFTKKTGTLRLRRSGGEGRVLFEDGQVAFAGSSSDRLALGRRLVGAGILSTDGLRQALDEQRRVREAGTGTRIGRILVDLGEIDEDTLETFVREQIQDAVFDLMRWPDGSFSFDERAADELSREPIRLAVSVENLIMEGSRRLEEWGQVRRKIPDLGAIVAMAPVIADDDAGERGVDVSLQPDEWRLLTVVDGRRSVRDLVDLFGQGEFHLCRILYGMVGAGLLVVLPPDEAGAAPASDLVIQRQLLRDLEEAAERAAADDATPTGPATAAPARAPEREPTPTARERPVPARPEGPPAPPPAATADEREDVRPTPTPSPAEEPAPQPLARPAAAQNGAQVSRDPAASGERRRPPLTADPALSEDLVRRLIDGVKEL